MKNLNALAISGLAFVVIFGSAIVGMLVRSKLPEHHLSAESKEVIRLATALIATLAALVLGLLIASTRSAYDQTSGHVSRITADVIELDNVLKKYGSETDSIRRIIREGLTPMVDSIWKGGAAPARGDSPFQPAAHDGEVLSRIEDLMPRDAAQRSAQSRARQLAGDAEQTRLMLYAQPSDSMSLPFVTVLILWLAFIFGSFGIFARTNATIVVVIFVCVLSASSAIFLILELGSPFDGLMQISSAALRNALAPITLSTR